MAILLIGSTGSGKSTLGNFLIDPSEEAIFDNQVFKVAKGIKPETQHAQMELLKKDSGGKKLTVIDTPGLNESDVHDLKHMIEIIETLQKVDAVLACILVIKFNCKIDAQYKATVQYYTKLLPSLFERNVIIVMTGFAGDERTERMRKRLGIDVKKIKQTTIEEIRESGSLTYDPIIFTIDCLPDDVEERRVNLSVRDAIISMVASQRPFTSKFLMVAKTTYLRNEDKEKIKGYEGEITGYNKRLQQANARATEALEKIQSKEQEITEKDKRLKVMRDELRDKDSSELIEIAKWSVSEEWQILQWLSKEFDISSPCEIEAVDKWTNGHCQWKIYEETKFRITGKVEGEFMRGIYASLSLQTSKRRKYEKEIDSLRRDISTVERDRECLKQQLDHIQNHYKEHIEDIKRLEDFIEETRVKIDGLVSDFMTLDEAHERLQILEIQSPKPKKRRLE